MLKKYDIIKPIKELNFKKIIKENLLNNNINYNNRYFEISKVDIINNLKLEEVNFKFVDRETAIDTMINNRFFNKGDCGSFVMDSRKDSIKGSVSLIASGFREKCIGVFIADPYIIFNEEVEHSYNHHGIHTTVYIHPLYRGNKLATHMGLVSLRKFHKIHGGKLSVGNTNKDYNFINNLWKAI